MSRSAISSPRFDRLIGAQFGPPAGSLTALSSSLGPQRTAVYAGGLTGDPPSVRMVVLPPGHLTN